MQKLISKTQAVQDKEWVSLEQEDLDVSAITDGASLACSLETWIEQSEHIKSKQPKDLHLLLKGDSEVNAICDDLSLFSTISIHFGEFKDGRGYSLARLLRERYQFTGELRATGDIAQDQLFYLGRCGFSTFLLREDQDVERSLKAFGEFSDVYQAAVDQPKPVYQR